MIISNYNQVQDFKLAHKNCELITKLTNDDKNTVVIRCAYHASLILASIPYRMFCMHPNKCAGRNSCPRDYAYSE